MSTREPLIGKANDQFVRSNQIIDRIRGLSRKGKPARAIEPVSRLIEEAVEIVLINPKYRGVSLKTNIEPNLPAVFVDKVQIQQVLLNLFRNAF